LIYSNCMCYTN